MIKHNPELLDKLQQRIGYFFKDVSLLRTAMTHSSYAYEIKASDVEDNERLEFLGDGILDFVIADALYNKIDIKMKGSSKWQDCQEATGDIASELELDRFYFWQVKWRLGAAKTNRATRWKPCLPPYT